MASDPRPVRSAIGLSLLSVAWSGFVGCLALFIALTTNSLSLLGFGADSAVDAVASLTLIWRFTTESRAPHRAEHVEAIAERVIGGVLLVIAAYLVIGSARALLDGTRPDASPASVVLLVASVALLPPLALAKRRTAAHLASGALRADSVLTLVGAGLAAVGLASTILLGVFGLWWADPVGALLIAAIVAREGWASVRVGLPDTA